MDHLRHACTSPYGTVQSGMLSLRTPSSNVSHALRTPWTTGRTPAVHCGTLTIIDHLR